MQQTMTHQLMGYDRAITMFSPDGRLLQVEYAKKTVKQGSTVVGMVCKDGVVLVADKRIVDKLIVPESIEKVFNIDEHIVAAAAGIVSDARVLVENAQIKAQQHKVTYDSDIDTLTVVKSICNLKQICTQSGGLRPFGVSLLVAGVDETGAVLYETDPTGIFFRYKATAIGEKDSDIEKMLEKQYKESITIEEGLKVILDAMKKVLDHDFDAARIEAAYIELKNPVTKRFETDEIEKILKGQKRK